MYGELLKDDCWFVNYDLSRIHATNKKQTATLVEGKTPLANQYFMTTPFLVSREYFLLTVVLCPNLRVGIKTQYD